MRKIDADSLKETISEWLNSLYDRQNIGSYDEITDTLAKISVLEIVIDIIDGAEIANENNQCECNTDHVSEWVPLNEMPFYLCSNCGSMFDTTICRNIFVLYCPRCGRRIKAVTDDD